jgi:hypothetical protein
MTVTGVVATPRPSSSAIAAGSSATFRAWNGTPCWVRNSSTLRQKIQPGWLKTVTDWAIVRASASPRSSLDRFGGTARDDRTARR